MFIYITVVKVTDEAATLGYPVLHGVIRQECVWPVLTICRNKAQMNAFTNASKNTLHYRRK